MAEEHHKEHHKEASVAVKKSTIQFLAFIVIALVVGVIIGAYAFNTGSVASVDKTVVGQKVVKYLNDNLVQAGTTATLVSVVEDKGLYKVSTLYQGQPVDVYSTADGTSLFVSQPLALDQPVANTNTQPQPTNIPKTDKPKVELFIMSYCPYGTQAEKGILPAVRALGDKIDFKIEYTHFTLHGAKEDTENFRQLCIREEQTPKFLPYIACILNSTSATAPGDVNLCMTSLGINTTKVTACMNASAANYYAVDSALSQGYGVQGSPTLIINGVTSNAGRDSASYLAAICAAFNNVPAECSTQLSSTQPGPGFGYDSVGQATAAGCGV